MCSDRDAPDPRPLSDHSSGEMSVLCGSGGKEKKEVTTVIGNFVVTGSPGPLGLLICLISLKRRWVRERRGDREKEEIFFVNTRRMVP